MMRILLIHNYYQQPGGEDQVFAAEAEMLEARGHQVLRHTVHNDAISGMASHRVAMATLWNAEQRRVLGRLIRQERPALAHFHNTFPLISPSAYSIAKRHGVAVVQTLHNYRLLCLNGLLLRDGKVCRECVGKALPWPGVRHACYRTSVAASGVTAAMLVLHRALGTWKRCIDRFIALTEFGKQEMVAGGLPAERIAVKPNFASAAPDVRKNGSGSFALFVGRLTPEKGITTLLRAWQRSADLLPPLKIVGDGPCMAEARERAAALPGVELTGALPQSGVQALMREAAMLVVPSEWLEGEPRTVIEAYACGTPVVASRIGTLETLIEDGVTGVHFRPGDADDLAAKVRWCAANPARLQAMRAAARAEYERKYTPEINYELLMSIYGDALAHAAGAPAGASGQTRSASVQTASPREQTLPERWR
jgi:glycosyltransferase involved in cell wall biosynthesis